MIRRFALLALSAMLAAPLAASAETSPPPTAAEAAFVKAATADLTKRFPTPKDAEKAGYARYTNEDETGAISYANLQWTSTDPKVPAQLWYDVRGHLIGADYSVLQSAHAMAPSILGLGAERAQKIGAHVHYVTKATDGSMTYDLAVGGKKYAAAGLDLAHPTADGLVKVGAVKSADSVALVFLYPAIWDVTVWLVPNPNGPFASGNPNVKPSKSASKM